LKFKEIPASFKTEKAIFAAGCFWGVESSFRKLLGKGVVSTRVGFTGGTLKDPTYKDVCSNTTGHAEAVEITYDPEEISYQELLDIFWSIHDPTTLNQQGPDVGSQYRSAIFFTTPDQEALARKSKNALAKSNKYKKSITTEITAAQVFYPAEDYHQQYFEKKGIKAGCHL